MYCLTCHTCGRPIQSGQQTTYIKGESCHLNVIDCFALRGIYVPGYSTDQIKENMKWKDSSPTPQETASSEDRNS